MTLFRRMLSASVLTGVAGGLVLGAILGFLDGGVVGGGWRAALVVVHTAAVQGLALGLLALVPAAILGAVSRDRGRLADIAPAVALLLIAGYGSDRWIVTLHRGAPRPWTGLAIGIVLALAVYLGRGLLDRAWRAIPWTVAAAAILVAAVGLPRMVAGEPGSAAAASPGPRESAVTEMTVPPVTPRNVLFVVIDTLRADRLSSYGYAQPTSPHLDRLAEQGVRFERAIVQKSKTSPSVASLFTGTYPHTHGIIAASTWLPDEAVTLAELVAETGRHTAAFVANSNVSATFNFHQGFRTHVQVKKKQGGNHAGRVNGHVLPWLEENHDEPFFLYVHYIDPHAPYDPPAPYRGRFEGDDLYAPWRDVHLPIGGGFARMIHRKAVIDGGATNLDLYLARYDEEVAYVDAAVGELLATLSALGRDHDTLVIVTSDHGESLTEHEVYFNHGLYAYEDNIRVPLVVRYPPAIAAGRVEEAVVEGIDLMPTILDFLGTPAGDRVEGASLAPLLLGASDTHEDLAFSEGGYDPEALIRTVRDRDWKLIWNPKGAEVGSWPFNPRVLISPTRTLTLWRESNQGPGGNARWELYDLRADPAEETNLAEREPEVFERLRRELEAWMARAPEERRPIEIEPGELPEDVADELRALGYIE